MRLWKNYKLLVFLQDLEHMQFICFQHIKTSFNHDDDFPAARDCNNFTMAIPLHNKMIKDDYDYVIAKLKDIDNGVL